MKGQKIPGISGQLIFVWSIDGCSLCWVLTTTAAMLSRFGADKLIKRCRLGALQINLIILSVAIQ